MRSLLHIRKRSFSSMAIRNVAALERSPTGGVFANAGSWLDAPTYLS